MTIRQFSSAVLVTVLAMCVTVTAGYVGARLAQAPAAESTSGPGAVDTLSVPVTQEALSRSVSFDAVLTPAFTVDVRQWLVGQSAGTQVVSLLPLAVGDVVRGGAPVAEISGRPVFALEGPLPAFRTLGGGMQGRDVRQLQRALNRIGIKCGRDAQGTFGAGTAQAVRTLYSRAGYRPLLGSDVGLGAAPEAVDMPAVPLGEIQYVPSLPATVATVDASVGNIPGDRLVSISGGAWLVSGSPMGLSIGDIAPRMAAHVTLVDGAVYEGWVSSVSSSVAAEGNAPQASVRVKTSTAIAGATSGTAARVQVVLATAPTAGLCVPTVALFALEDGRSAVRVMHTGGAQEDVAVTVAFQGDGRVQVVPESPRGLSVGDRVVVGGQLAVSAGGSP